MEKKECSLNKDLIKKLTTLSRIKCTDEEAEALSKDLASILGYIDLLDEINTDNISPCNHVIEGVCNVFREDEVTPALPRELFLKNAPAHVGGMIKVPPVIHGHES